MALHQTTRDALPVRLGNRKYNIDVSRLARATVDPIRQGFDTQGTPGEQTLNQAGVWKRTRSDWEFGAGQREADMLESEQRKFNASTGINPWVKGELSLHKTTAVSKASANTNLYMATASVGATNYVYMANASNIEYSTDDGANWSGSPIVNPASGAVLGIASDGTNIYVAGTAGKVQKIAGITVGSSTGNEWSMGGMAAGDGVWVANGYLIASDGPRLTVLPSGSDEATSNDITSATFSQVDSWSSVIGTPTGIYAAGNRGNRGRIYHIGINDSTSSLRAPVIAAELPHGETINALSEYSGLLCLGTSKGVRLAQMALATGNTFGGAATGFIQYGPRIDITNGVKVFDSQGEFIWFGWENYDSPFDTTTRSGLGRLSLREFTGPLTPAYASDLMVGSKTAAVQGVVLSGTTRLFSISGAGAYKEHASNYEITGSIDEGRFRWGTTELKAAVSVDLRHSELATGQSMRITIQDDTGGDYYTDSEVVGSYTPGIKAVQVSSQKDPTDYGLVAADLQYVSTVSSVTGEYISPTIKLNGPGTSTPTLYRWTVRAVPMPFVAEVIQLPIILTTQTRYDSRDIYQDTYDDYQYVRSLLEDRSLITFEMGDESRVVHVAGLAYQAGEVIKWVDDRGWVEGLLTVTIITVQGN
tara:strand:+ start:505 stop:2442 length:1938 start_codon:yes stop_codon:yes gene_type:complete